MRKSSEMYVASRQQNMVQICAWNTCFATKLHFDSFCSNSFWALCVESPHGGAIHYQRIAKTQLNITEPSLVLVLVFSLLLVLVLVFVLVLALVLVPVLVLVLVPHFYLYA